MNLALVVLLPLLGCFLPPLLIRGGRNACFAGTFAINLASLLLILGFSEDLLRGYSQFAVFRWLPQFGIDFNFHMDALGLVFATMISGIGLLIVTYARSYLSKDQPMGRFYSYLLLFQGAMLGVVLSDNIYLLLIFWELTSISSFLLIGFSSHLAEGRQGARQALAITGAGGLALIVGLMLLAQAAGSSDLSYILTKGEVIAESPWFVVAMVLVLVGCFTKSAQFPFHFWLPHAMAAPTPVSAYLHSATMVKAGIFLLARLWPLFAGSDWWFYMVSTTGLVTMLVGAIIANFKDDLKGLLAYSTISHLGLITMLLGFGHPMALVAAILHIINHATFKAALFMNAGIVDHEAGTRQISRLGGLMRLMPISATMATIAAASMAGLPLFNGFLSKEMMLEQTLLTPWAGQSWFFPIMATIAACFSVAYSIKYIRAVYGGPERHDYPHHPHDPPVMMWLPPMILVAMVILIGLFPEYFVGDLLRMTVESIVMGAAPAFHLAQWHGFTPALMLSAIAVAVGIGMLLRLDRLEALWLRLPVPDGKKLFMSTVQSLQQRADAALAWSHNGSLQRYFALMLMATLAAGFIAFVNSDLSMGDRPALEAPAVAYVAVALMIGACLLAVSLHRQRLLALLTVGVVGLMVSMAFVYLSAPDLALTQISVEVVTVILMLLALYYLPKSSQVESPLWLRGRDALIAVACGAGIGWMSWLVMSRDLMSLSQYYLEQSVPLGGGANVVNVILVDFRGFDTFGEIIVLGIAALTIFALLDHCGGSQVMKSFNNLRDQQQRARAEDRHPMMMVIATRVMLPLALMVGAYIFARGHNLPGGGFIAGLVIAIALIMQYMASGFAWAAQRFKFDYHALIGAGVLVAGATGLGAIAVGYPFLTSAFSHLHLPILGDFEIASAMAFDIGVFLTVVGAVMLALANLSRLGRRLGAEGVNKEAMDIDPSQSISGSKG